MKRVTKAIPAILCSTSLFFIVGCDGNSSGGDAAVKPANIASESSGETASNEMTKATTPREVAASNLAAAKGDAAKPVNQVVNATVSAGTRGAVQDPATDDGVVKRPAQRLADREALVGGKTPGGKTDITALADPNAPIVVRPEPAQLYLGEISTGDSGIGSIKLMNSGTEVMKLVECKSSCGCTTTNCPKGQEIAPGESIELEVRLNAGAMPSDRISKSLTYVIEHHPLITVPVTAKVVSYIAIEPEVLDTDISLDGTVTLRAIDDTPFVITSMIPPIIQEFSTEPAVEQTVTIDWDEYVNSAFRGRLTFYTNHPKCRAVYGNVRGVKQQEAIAKLAEQRNKNGQNPRGPSIQPVAKDPPLPQRQFEPQQVTLTAADARLHAFTKVENIEAMKKALSEGATVDARDANGKTAMHIAAMEGKVGAMDALLEAGADIESRDRGGRTPLMWAVESNNPAAVKHLLDAGADLEARDETGGTPLMWAAGFGNPETLTAILAADPELAVTDDHGMTPLMWAASFGDGERAKMLIDAGINIDLVDGTRGCTAVMYAARSSGSVETLQSLIDAGADLSLVDVTGRTALSWAALLGTPEKVQALIAGGSDVLKEDFRGWAPLKYAENRRDRNGPMIVSLLKEATAKANDSGDKSASESSEPIDPQARR